MAAVATRRSSSEYPEGARHGFMALSLGHVEAAVNVPASIQ
jgi:hypothetical protein